VLKVYDRCNQTTAIQFIDEVRRRLPFRILVVQTDNGANSTVCAPKGWCPIAHRVSRRVNKPEKDEPELLTLVEA